MSSDLRDKAMAAAKKAHSPYSKVQVGSAILTEDGSVYQGCNIENSSYGGTVCAERVAIWKAVSEGHKRIKKVYVYTNDGWPPCGLCLQVMTEFSTPDLEIILGNQSGKELKKALKDFLPFAFTQEHLK